MPAEKSKMKSSKPLMEKRRRARINDSLMQLKALVLDALNKNNSRHSKLEKADILEMTVRYLRTIQRQQISASASSDPTVLGQYRSGYAQCINEVTHYLGTNATTSDGAPELRTRLVGHLANLCTSGQQQQTQRAPAPSRPQEQQSPVTFQVAQMTYQQQQQVLTRQDTPVVGGMVNTAVPTMQVITHMQQPSTSVPMQRISPNPEGARTEYSLTTPVYNTVPRGLLSPTAVSARSPTNSAQLVQSVPVGVTGALPSGEITLVLPQQSLPNGQVPTHLIPVYAPAGSAVLSPSTTNTTNIQSATPNAYACHVSMSSPRVAATVPCTLSPTGPQSSMTIPAQHAQVVPPTPPSSTPAQVAYSIPVQTKLSPVRKFTHHQWIEPAREQSASVVGSGQCVTKSDPMWRPW